MLPLRRVTPQCAAHQRVDAVRADQEVDLLAGTVGQVQPYPGLILGGGALRTGARFVDRIAESVLARCTDLVTRDLVIRPASLEQHEGVIGAGLLAGAGLLSPVSLAHWAEHGPPWAVPPTCSGSPSN